MKTMWKIKKGEDGKEEEGKHDVEALEKENNEVEKDEI